MPFFNDIIQLPEDPILTLPILFKADPHPKKVNLGIGVYHDTENKPYIFSSVREAENIIHKKEQSKEYLPIEGDPVYIQETLKLVFGEANERIFGAQTVGGASALRTLADFLGPFSTKNIYISDPSWPNHEQIFIRSGLKVNFYPYYNSHTHGINFSDFASSIKKMAPRSIILLQACCHNPTGSDMTFEQWKEISKLIKSQNLIPFFDLAYQGFGKDIEEDAKPIRFFVEEGHELAVAISFSKNFGLYGERAGALALVVENKEIAQKAGTHLKKIIRTSYSNPPRHPALIVSTILSSPELKSSWKKEIATIRSRIEEMREALAFGLMTKAIHEDWRFITKQKGLFTFSGLNEEQVKVLRQEHGIYILSNGRINIAGINPHNLEYVVDSIHTVMKI